jgi:hypothetical protein
MNFRQSSRVRRAETNARHSGDTSVVGAQKELFLASCEGPTQRNGACRGRNVRDDKTRARFAVLYDEGGARRLGALVDAKTRGNEMFVHTMHAHIYKYIYAALQLSRTFVLTLLC